MQRKKMKFFDLLPFTLYKIKKTPITIHIPIELRKNNVSDTLKTSLPYKILPYFSSPYIVNGNGCANHNYYKFFQSQNGNQIKKVQPTSGLHFFFFPLENPYDYFFQLHHYYCS